MFLAVIHGHVCELHVQILVHRSEGTGDACVVLQFHCNSGPLLDKGLEERKKQHDDANGDTHGQALVDKLVRHCPTVFSKGRFALQQQLWFPRPSAFSQATPRPGAPRTAFPQAGRLSESCGAGLLSPRVCLVPSLSACQEGCPCADSPALALGPVEVFPAVEAFRVAEACPVAEAALLSSLASDV